MVSDLLLLVTSEDRNVIEEGRKEFMEQGNAPSEFKHTVMDIQILGKVFSKIKVEFIDYSGSQGRRLFHQSIPEESHFSVCPPCMWPVSEGTASADSSAPVPSSQGGFLCGPSGTRLRHPGKPQTLRRTHTHINENATTVSKISAHIIQTLWLLRPF